MKKLAFILTVMGCLLIGTTTFAKELPTMTEVETNKAFAIRFDDPMDFSSMTDNIYVVDEKNNVVKTILVLNDTQNIVYVIPALEYKDKSKYKLVITKKVKGANNMYLAEESSMEFITK